MDLSFISAVASFKSSLLTTSYLVTLFFFLIHMTIVEFYTHL